jgi:hypothetical protein
VKTEQAETSSNDRDDAPAGLALGGAGARGWVRKITDIPEFGVVAACVLVFIIVTLVHHDFADIANLQVIGLDLADYGILAVGVSMVIMTSGIDLSPGSMVAFCSMCSAYVNVNWHWPVLFSILASGSGSSSVTCTAGSSPGSTSRRSRSRWSRSPPPPAARSR